MNKDESLCVTFTNLYIINDLHPASKPDLFHIQRLKTTFTKIKLEHLINNNAINGAQEHYSLNTAV